MVFEPGKSGNPKGRPKMPLAVREMARQHTQEAIDVLCQIMNDVKVGPQNRLTAANSLLDRGWGKPTHSLEFYALQARSAADPAARALAAAVIDVYTGEPEALIDDAENPGVIDDKGTRKGVSPFRKLTMEEKQHLKWEALNTNQEDAVIAEKYGIASSNVYDCRHRIQYMHVTPVKPGTLLEDTP